MNSEINQLKQDLRRREEQISS